MNSSDPDASNHFVPFSPAECEELEIRFYGENRMVRYGEWVMDLVELRRNEILHLANGTATPEALLKATQRVIGERGSMNQAAELKDQIKEMEKELWYRGEKGDHDHAGIKLQWTVDHAAAWRRGRIREYQFVAEHYATEVVALLLLASKDSNQAAS